MQDQRTYPPVLLTVNQFAAKHPAFSKGALRDLIFYSQPRRTSKGSLPGNGLDQAIVRLGRRVLLDEARFFEWVGMQQESIRLIAEGTIA